MVHRRPDAQIKPQCGQRSTSQLDAWRITNLEQTLNRTLFERRPDGYLLTAAGQAALTAAGGMESAAGLLEIGEPGEGLSGLVRLTATSSLAEVFLIPHLAVWQASHPGLEIEVSADMAPRSLMRHAADIALRLARPSDGEVTERRLIRIGYGFYATPDWCERIEAGAALVFSGFDEANAHIPEAIWLAQSYPGDRVILRSSTQVSQAIAARSGQAIALLPHFLGRRDSILVPVHLPKSPPVRELWMLTRRDAVKMPRLRAVIEYLIDLFRQERRLFAEG